MDPFTSIKAFKIEQIIPKTNKTVTESKGNETRRQTAWYIYLYKTFRLLKQL